uniref:Uncharacterized protein n=1 Tax=Arcella intermedia TaxID=1963864 RepID=A0A6B2LML6_9EUKA
MYGHFQEEYDPDIEDIYRKPVSIDGKCYTLDVLDPIGEDEFATLRDQYYKSGEGFLMIYSICSKQSLDEVNVLRGHILRVKEVEIFPMVLCGNKCDLGNERQCSVEDGKVIAGLWGISFFETSALTGVNVEKAFLTLAREIIQWKISEGFSTRPPPKKKGGCYVL